MISEQKLSTYCMLALVLIGALGLLANVVQQGAIRESDGMAAVINESGRQRMLTQLIGSLASEYMLGDGSVRDELVGTVKSMETGHRDLSGPYRVDGTGTAHELHQMYFEGPDAVDAQVGRYLTDAEEVGNSVPKDPSAEFALHEMQVLARGSLRDHLNEIVLIHQRELEGNIKTLKRLEWALYVLMVAVLLGEWLLLFRPVLKKLVKQSEEMVELVVSDPLTGVYNRRGFYEKAEEEFQRAERYGRELTVVLMDVDNFKALNDAYGHFAGDEVLRELGSLLQENLRPSDVVGRLGGEEFVVLLAETGVAGAVRLADRLRMKIEAIRLEYEEKMVRVTASFGVCGVKLENAGLDAALKSADVLLYKAKESGRNQVVVEGGPAVV